MSLVGQNRAYEPAALAIISFADSPGLAMGAASNWSAAGRHAAQRSVVAASRNTVRSRGSHHGVSHAHRHLQRPSTDTVAVEDFNLDVERGEFVSFLGPSGCGKTTTLRMIAGFETPTSGHDRDQRRGHHLPAAQPAQRRHGVPVLCAVPQHDGGGEHRLRPEGGQATGRRDPADAWQEMLELIHLPELGDRYPYQLSGGQQQRVALARALAHPAPGAAARRAALGAGRQDPGAAAHRDPRASSRSWGSPRST